MVRGEGNPSSRRRTSRSPCPRTAFIHRRSPTLPTQTGTTTGGRGGKGACLLQRPRDAEDTRETSRTRRCRSTPGLGNPLELSEREGPPSWRTTPQGPLSGQVQGPRIRARGSDPDQLPPYRLVTQQGPHPRGQAPSGSQQQPRVHIPEATERARGEG